MPGGPRSPFRLLGSHRNQSISTSSLLTLARSASSLRWAHVSPDHRQQKNRNYIMGAKDVMKWMGGRNPSAALTTMPEPRAQAASNERKRRASLSSLSNLFGFGRSPPAEGSSNASQTFASRQDRTSILTTPMRAPARAHIARHQHDHRPNHLIPTPSPAPSTPAPTPATPRRRLAACRRTKQARSPPTPL
ncbi:hypothetical protein OC834_007574 [Tilletia horrida]|nr:hypothetical protein OC834_007574 [Tilletia horrida]